MDRHHERTPEWIDHMKQDTIPKTTGGHHEDLYWRNDNSYPRHHKGGFDNAFISHGKYGKGHNYSQTTLNSKKSIRTEEAKKQKRLGLVLLLLLCALLLAVGVALLVYFLMMQSDTSFGTAEKMVSKLVNETRATANVSVPAMSGTFTEDMKDNTSAAFQTVAEPFCREIDTYFSDSRYTGKYHGCKVTKIRLNPETIVCNCPGVAQFLSNKSFEIFYDLVFYGDADELQLKTGVQRTIEDHATHLAFGEFDLIIINKYIVDVRRRGPTPTQQPTVHSGVLTQLSIVVYNLTWDDALLRNNSYGFWNLARPFCDDLKGIFLRSTLSNRFLECKVDQFRQYPKHIVVTHIPMSGYESVGLGKKVVEIVLDGAKRVWLQDKEYRMIGTLLIEPTIGMSITQINVTIDVPSIQPTATTVTYPGGLLTANVKLFMYNLTYTDVLGHPQSSNFKSLSGPFCKDLERFYHLSSLAARYIDCTVVSFSPAETNMISTYSTIMYQLRFRYPNMVSEESIIQPIRTNAPAVPIEENTMLTYLVGDILVLLDPAVVTFDIRSEIVQSTTSASSLSPSMDITSSKVWGTAWTTYKFITPTVPWTPDPHTPMPTITKTIIYDASKAFVTADLYDFHYSPDLGDSNSQRFGMLQRHFCDDLKRYYDSSFLSPQFRECEIDSFDPDPTSVSFHLTFNAPLGKHLQSNVTTVMDKMAPHEWKNGLELLDVGDLKMIWNSYDIKVSVANYTDATAIHISPTTSLPITRTVPPPIVYSATQAIITCGVENASIPVEFNDKSSQKFLSQQKAFCDDVSSHYGNSNLATAYRREMCEILTFGQSPSTVKFSNVFTYDLIPALRVAVLSILENNAPQTVKDGSIFFSLGELLLISGSCNVVLVPINITDSPAPSRTIYPTSVEPLPTSLYFRSCLRFPCKHGGTCHEASNSKYICECPAGWTGQDCERDIDECSVYRCLNGGKCVNREGSYVCNCADGWYGKHCEIDVKECQMNQCLYDGTCIEVPGSFRCVCPTGRTGATCEYDVNECENQYACLNGYCQNTPGSFYCVCNKGWTGNSCETDIDECSQLQCMNSGTCVNHPGTFTCICPSGFSGDYCLDDNNECKLFPGICQNNGSCSNTFGSYDCRCLPGFSGTNCTRAQCETNICKNGGVCRELVSSFQCECPMGFTGQRCESDINECLEFAPCKNLGSCENTYGSYYCRCPSGWIGVDCDVDMNECSSFPCFNGGTCRNLPGSYICDCKVGWSGQDCRGDVNECVQYKPCKNRATCQNSPGSYFCYCIDGWQGQNCTNDIDECIRMPCGNNGSCINQMGTYKCDCPRNWQGQDCLDDVDECVVYSPCLNGGTCINEIGSYSCVCSLNARGPNCEDEELCFSNQCRNGATCRPDGNSYSCVCPPGFQGRHCDEDINECAVFPCSNNATCKNSYGSYTCICTSEWEGSDCRIDRNECIQLDPCLNGGTCINDPGSYHCDCPPHMRGKHCEADDTCLQNPCLNGGTCRKLVDPGQFICDCPLNWMGLLCDTDVNECELEICYNNATCVNSIGSFKCNCARGWTGKRCAEDEDECGKIECLNGGTCVNFRGSYICRCPAGFTGNVCESDIDECKQYSPCDHGGTCENTPGSFRCFCPNAWNGENCRENANECAVTPNLCKNGGTCHDTYGSYDCECSAAYYGSHCENDTNECLTFPCDNGGTCINNEGGFVCQCPPNWDGQYCRKDKDECLIERPCQNSGICTNTPGSYYCRCPQGWTDNVCGTDVDECRDFFPCQHNSNCTNLRGSYTCNCQSGWMGDACERDVDECAFSPCQHGGNCTNTAGSFFCRCPLGWQGATCDTDVDECLRFSCMNGGNCTNYPGSFSCKCSDFWTGTHCDRDVDECVLNPDICSNGGTCINIVGSYLCRCPEGWTGSNCEDDEDECLRFPCRNSGNCTNIFGSFVCSCPSEWTGDICDRDADECEISSPCMNGGTCMNTYGSYRCDCPPLFTGQTCEGDVDRCLAVQCMNGGKCDGRFNTNICDCPAQWTGDYCDKDVDECLMYAPCANGGSCRNLVGSYKCDCTSGWSGENCKIDNDECLNNICGHNSTCINSPGAYTCICNAGWTGPNCLVDKDECELNPCQNGAVCINTPGSYQCNCTNAWEGKHCGTDKDECLNDPALCLHGGTCINTVGGFICECLLNWIGEICDEDVNECLAEPCRNSGFCTNTVGSYLCADCGAGWEGDNCEQDINECSTGVVVCMNGATCTNLIGSFTCGPCPRGWSGTFCEEDIDECLTLPCANNGNCTNLMGSYECSCTEGWTGSDCRTDINDCLQNPCQNGGICLNKPGYYECRCTDGWIGKNCELDFSECSLNPCKHGGICEDMPGSYRCQCSANYTGKDCELDYDECFFDKPCMNAGTCYNMDGSYLCQCTPNFEGENCTEDVNECLDSPCRNSGFCTNTVGSYLCADCGAGWEGDNCEQDINECSTGVVVCMNGATCTNLIGSFTCGPCPRGWSGTFCEEDIDECLALPCANNGTCTNLMGSFECSCTEGWTGSDCRTDINDCLQNPCQNGGICLNKPGYYECRCTDGWIGKNCELDFSECSLNPCKHGGICEDIPGSYRCQCSANYTGKDCELDYDECIFDMPCMNDGTCYNMDGSYLCQCTPNFEGKNCTEDKDECLNNPCHGGTCDNTYGSYICNCPPGSTGTDCTGDLNECVEFAPCRNGGQCTNTIGSYYCDCPDNWTGENCTDDVDECLQQPPYCLNGATCRNTEGSYECICMAGWMDKNCDTNINECLQNVCLNGASCLDTSGSYQCLCQSDFTGPNCEIAIDTAFRISWPVMNLTYSPELSDNTSVLYQYHENLFCRDLEDLMGNHTHLIPDFKNCRIDSFSQNPVNGEIIVNWDAIFRGKKQPDTQTRVERLVFEDFQKKQFADKLGVVVGDLLIYYTDYPTTDLVMDLTVLNMTWTRDLENPNSAEYQYHAGKVCSDISRLLREEPTLFPTYKECLVKEFLNNPNKIIFDLIFEGNQDPLLLEQNVYNVLYSSLPKFRYEKWMGYMLGDFLIFYEDYTDFTDIPMTFEILNLTWSNALADKNSVEFQYHAKLFCDDLDKLLKTHPAIFPTYQECRIDRFGNNPVTIYIIVQFDGVVPVQEMASQIAGIIFEDAPRYRYLNTLGNLMGDLLIFYSTWDNPLHDAWLSNMTFYLYNFDYRPELQNSSSQLFREYEDRFCSGIDSFFQNSNLSDRYYRCFIDSFSSEEELHFGMIFEGSESILELQIMDTIRSSAREEEFQGIKVMWIADMYVLDGKADIREVNITNYATQPPVVVNTILEMSYELANLTWHPDLDNPDSPRFQSLSDAICSELSEIYINSTDDYSGCQVQSFTFNITGGSHPQIWYHLIFQGQQRVEFPLLIHQILVENGRRASINRTIYIVIGGLAFYIKSISNQFRTVIPSTTSPTITTPLPDIAFCEDITVDGYYANPESCHSYYYCYMGMTYMWNCQETEVPGSRDGMTFKMVYNGTADIDEQILLNIIQSQADKYSFQGLDVMLIGDMFVYLGGRYDEIRVNMTDYLTTTPPIVNTVVNISFVLMNLTHNQDLSNSESAYFKSLADPFCGDLNTLYTARNRFPDYDGCRVWSFSRNPERINFYLKFRGEQGAELQELIYGILIENAPRAKVNGQITIVVGTLAVFEESLVIDQQTVPVGPSTTAAVTTPKPVITTVGSIDINSLCVNNQGDGFKNHPSNCEKYVFCWSNSAFEFDCAPQEVFFVSRGICDTNDGTIQC